MKWNFNRNCSSLNDRNPHWNLQRCRVNALRVPQSRATRDVSSSSGASRNLWRPPKQQGGGGTRYLGAFECLNYVVCERGLVGLCYRRWRLVKGPRLWASLPWISMSTNSLYHEIPLSARILMCARVGESARPWRHWLVPIPSYEWLGAVDRLTITSEFASSSFLYFTGFYAGMYEEEISKFPFWLLTCSRDDNWQF